MKLLSNKLRFSEFTKKWENKRLNQLGRFISGVGFADSEQGGKIGIPFLKVSDMNLVNNKIKIQNSTNYVSEEQIEKNKYKVITDNAIIFAKIGAAIFLERKRIAKDFLLDNNMMAFVPNGNVYFFYYLFNNIRLSKFAQVGALPSYNSSDLGIIKVFIPLQKEQEKIAKFLKIIDEKIQLETELLIQYENQKKYLLQNLFV